MLNLLQIRPLTKKLSDKNHYHFIGIGGIGMSGIALALISKGYSVSGSDLISNEETSKLKDKGAIVFKTQKKENIEIIKNKFPKRKIFIVTSTAIKKTNRELNFCIKNKYVIKHRSEILSLLMESYESIGVAGTHGKTSTSTFLSILLDLCTKNSSSIVGGINPIYKTNSYVKENKYLVAEIDESDGSTSNYKTDLGIINNIDFDHCDYYKNIEELISSFTKFAANSKKILINYDCKLTRKYISSDYKWSIKRINGMDYSLIPKKENKDSTIADYYEKGNYIDTLNIPIPGLHNLSNVTAAISTCRIKNVSLKQIKEKINKIKLPKKRFEVKGELKGRTIIDDYAHHPKEISATLKLARLIINNEKENKRLVAIFQPHRYSRVYQFANEFAEELSKADQIILTDIYSAGEKNEKKINSLTIANKIYKNNKNIKILKDNYEIKKYFYNITKAKDLIINMGAGDCHNLWSILNAK